MSTQQYSRPDTLTPDGGESGLPNRDKFQGVSATVPKIPISSEDIDSEFNNIIDACNELFDTALSGTVPDNSITLAKLSHLTAGSLYYMNGSGVPTELGKGTAGQVLTMNAGATIPEWAAVTTAPTGSINAYAGSSAPSGHLLCDGSAVSRATYSALFALVSTTYGVGDGSTTFNVPDLKGRVPAGLDNMGGGSADRITDAQADTLGGSLDSVVTTGSVTVDNHSLSISEMPAHDHVQRWVNKVNSTTWDPSGVSLINMEYPVAGSPNVTNAVDVDVISTQTSVSASSDDVTTTSTGGGSGHNHSASFTADAETNIQPSLFLNYIIKT